MVPLLIVSDNVWRKTSSV